MIVAALGWVLVVLGVVVFLIPFAGWPGFLIIVIGTVLVLRNSRWSRKRFIHASKRYPSTAGRFRRWLARRAASNGETS